jgi:Na+-driven multidrug efflux pump
MLLNKPLLGFYGIVPGEVGSLEQIAYDTAMKRMWILMMPYFLCGLMNVPAGVAKSLGKSMTSTVISLIGAGALRLSILFFIFPLIPRLEVVYLSFPITWIVTATAQYICVFSTMRHIQKREKEEKSLQTV